MVVNLDVAWVCAMKDLQAEMKRHGIKANHDRWQSPGLEAE
jgi:hypothetical protein